MRATVCELPNEPAELKSAWDALVAHVRSRASDLVLLPEMPFYRWLPHTRDVRESEWLAAVRAHDEWMMRLDETGAMVIGTRPVLDNGIPGNTGYIKEPAGEARAVHDKYYLPDEPGFWEASWYRRGDGSFKAVDTSRGRVGLLICTELWFNHHAREYAGQGIQLLACPRATPASSSEKWVVGGRAAAVVAGAFCLSSNLSGRTRQGAEYAGRGWVIEPEEGDVLGITAPDSPFLTIDVDLEAADRAKRTYPRYVEA
jgi:N-carbamoylputrescine amidase